MEEKISTALHQDGCKSAKILLPQILATCIVTCINTLVGSIFGYSAIFIPQLLEEQNSTDTNVVQVTQSDVSWIISTIILSSPFGAIGGGFLMGAIGRLNLLKLMAIPGVLGWSLIALSSNVAMMITGRLLLGIALVWAANPASVYMTEITRPDVRGTLTSAWSLGASVGMLLVYIKGRYLHWRVIAWMQVGFTVLFTAFVFFLPESPVWLLSKHHDKEARKSLGFFHKYHQRHDEDESSVELQLGLLVKQNEVKEQERNKLGKNGTVQLLKMFAQPVGYKPMLIMVGLYFFQQFCGMYVVISNGVIFVEEMGTTVDPYLATICIGVLRLVMTIVNMFLMKKYRRRTLMMTSGVGMALFLCISGLYTKWLHEGTTTTVWVPILALMFYIIFAISYLTIPFAIQAEVFPLAIRGLAHAMVSCVCHFFVFCALQSYFPLKDFLGGSFGLQFFYSAMAFFGALFVYVFMPETHNKELIEIENYFWKHTTYLSVSQKEEKGEEETTSSV